MSQEYDNTNRGSCWRCLGANGKANLDGVDYYAYLIVLAPKTEKAPAAMLFLTANEHGLLQFPLWKAKENDKGEIFSGGNDAYWLNVYKCTSEKANAPSVQFKFSPKQEQLANAGYEGHDEFVGGDDIPF